MPNTKQMGLWKRKLTAKEQDALIELFMTVADACDGVTEGYISDDAEEDMKCINIQYKKQLKPLMKLYTELQV